MPGGRQTHSFPKGMPAPLWLLRILFFTAMLLWMVFSDGAVWWLRFGPIAALMAGYALVGNKLLSHYERTGPAIPLPRRQITVVRYPSGLPAGMLFARCAFFVTVAVMLVFGLAPLAESTARGGIVGCVFALIAVAVLNLALERHYVNTGRAVENDVRQK